MDAPRQAVRAEHTPYEVVVQALAICKALNMLWALMSVSWYSRAGSESATIPASPRV